MKTANELEKLDREATDAENEFWIQAGETIASLLKEKGECVNGVYSVDVEKLFGKDCATIYTTTIENDGVSGSEGSDHEWDLEELCVENDILSIQCEGYDFNLSDFERDSAILLARKLEEYHA